MNCQTDISNCQPRFLNWFASSPWLHFKFNDFNGHTSTTCVRIRLARTKEFIFCCSALDAVIQAEGLWRQYYQLRQKCNDTATWFQSSAPLESTTSTGCTVCVHLELSWKLKKEKFVKVVHCAAVQRRVDSLFMLAWFLIFKPKIESDKFVRSSVWFQKNVLKFSVKMCS